MAVTTTKTNKPLNPRGNDQSPKGYNRAALYSGKALDFDGVNDYVQCDNLNTLSTSDFTICYAYKYEATGDNWGVVQGGTGTNNTIITGKHTSGSIRFAFFGNDLDAPVSETPALGEWMWLAFTYNRTTKERKIYINGVLAAEDISAANPNPTAYSFRVGSWEALGGYYNNQVSNVKVYSTALTAAQVSDLYNNPEKIVPTGVSNDALKLWLPMMEGAGTTAYDGSGNGNHGTISGGTYVNGVGAPVAQSAVIDWNKAENRFSNSENFDGSSGWVFSNVTKVSEDNQDPRGTNTAVQISWPSGSAKYFYRGVDTTGSPSTIYLKVYVKSATGTNQNFRLFGNNVTQISNDFVATNEWQQFEFNHAYSNTFWGIMQSSAEDSSNILVAFPHTAIDDSPYLTTLTTAQPNKVLLPQGLTTGRDITGVNLFENVRKQGALNLDGNSWAEVHDNASVDVADFTMECWIKFNELTGNYQLFFAKDDSATDRSFELYLEPTEDKFGASVFVSNNAVFNTSTINTTDWVHIVSTFNDTTNDWNGYVNGVLNKNASIAVAPNYTDGPIIIGAWYTKTQFNTHGQIAQPRIYNRALTAEEVQRNYNAGKNIYK